MPKPFVVWKLTEATKDYYFQAPENHYVNGAVTAANTGVVLATDDEVRLMPLIKVEALLKSSVATRRRLSIRIGTGPTAKRRSVDFVIASNKVDEFETLNAGAYTTFNGQAATILGVVEPLRATFS